MISQDDLAQILTEHHGVPAGETEAHLLAGLILDEYQRNGAVKTLRDCVDAARNGYPGFFRSPPTAPAAAPAAPAEPVDPREAAWPISMRVMREAKAGR